MTRPTLFLNDNRKVVKLHPDPVNSLMTEIWQLLDTNKRVSAKE